MIDSILFVNQSTNEKTRYENVKALTDNSFKFKSLKHDKYKVIIYNFGYSKQEYNCKITNIPSSNLSITLNRKPVKQKIYNCKKKIAGPVLSNNEVDIFEYPASPFKNYDDSLVYFINRRIDNNLLKKNNIDELEIIFKIDSLGKAKLLDIKVNKISANKVIQNEFSKAIDLIPNWIITPGLNFKEATFSYIYDIK